MKIETITAHYSLTQSLSGYCNVRPSLSATAALEEGEDPDEVMDSLIAQLREKVQAHVDEALEGDGEPPRYFKGRRYSVLRASVPVGPYIDFEPVAYLVWPSDQGRPDGPSSVSWGTYYSERRLEVCLELVRSLAEEKRKLPSFVSLDGVLSDELVELLNSERVRLERERPRQETEMPDEDEDKDDEWDDRWVRFGNGRD